MSQRLKTIQALRGIAAIAVVLCHYRLYLRQNENYGNLWDTLFSWGFVGVDIFFMVSGFIMAYTTHDYPTSYDSSKKFIVNRIIRILPTYYFCLLFAFLFGGAMSIFHYEDKTKDLISAITFIVHKSDILPYYIDTFNGLLFVRWTLNFEIYFYIIFSFCLLSKFRFSLLLLWCLLSVIIVPMLYGNSPTLDIQGYKVHTALYGFLSNPLIIEFLVGVAAGLLYIRMKSLNIKNIFLVLSLVLMCYIIYIISTGLKSNMDGRVTLPIGALILFLALAEDKINMFIPHFLLWLGDISYSLYLIHMPLGLALFDRVADATHAPFIGIPYVLIAMLFSLVFSYFSHKYIEVRLGYWLKNKIIPA